MSQSQLMKRRKHIAYYSIMLGIILLLLISILSLYFGAKNVSITSILDSFFSFDETNSLHTIIRNIRLPRIIAAIFIGICFSISGSIMQGITRNPLADSGLLGINAGAAFALALSFAFIPNASNMVLLVLSFLGAGVAAVFVYLFGASSKGGLTPIRLILAGTAISALLGSLSTGIALYYNVSQDVMFFTAGGLSRINWDQILFALPWVIICIFGSILISPSITILSLGDDISKGLGLHSSLIKGLAVILTTLSAATAVTFAGSIGFIGLMIPHMVRYVVGVDYKYILPTAMIYGAILCVFCDMLARSIHPPIEVPLGAIISIIGVPFFLFLARKELHVL